MRYLSSGVIAAALIVSACGGGATPTSPTVTTAPLTGTLEGSIFTTTSTGTEPIAGARVLLQIGGVMAETDADQTGRYGFANLPDGIASLTTTKSGFESDRRVVTLQGTTRLDIGLVARGSSTISGAAFEMTASGRVPVEGVYVTGAWDYPVFTDANGFFDLFTCGESPCDFYTGATVRLYISKAGYRRQERQIVVDGNTRVEIEMFRE